VKGKTAIDGLWQRQWRSRYQRGISARRWVDTVGADRLGDILEGLKTEILPLGINLANDLVVDFSRNTDPTGLADAFDPRGYINTVTIDTCVIDDHVSLVDADPELHAFRGVDGRVTLGHSLLDSERAFHCPQDTGELG